MDKMEKLIEDHMPTLLGVGIQLVLDAMWGGIKGKPTVANARRPLPSEVVEQGKEAFREFQAGRPPRGTGVDPQRLRDLLEVLDFDETEFLATYTVMNGISALSQGGALTPYPRLVPTPMLVNGVRRSSSPLS